MHRYEDVQSVVAELEKIHGEVRQGADLEGMVARVARAVALYRAFRADLAARSFTMQAVRRVDGRPALEPFDWEALGS